MATIQSPTDGATFKAGDVITFSGTATDAEDGTLPASAYTWNVDFLHDGHVHPGTPIAGVTGGTFTIPTSGHDFSGNTRYRITLTVTDSERVAVARRQSSSTRRRSISPSIPHRPGGTIYIDGVAHTGPFVYDTLVGFNHTIEARDQVIGDEQLCVRLVVGRRCADSHHHRACGRADIYGDLQRRSGTGVPCVRAGPMQPCRKPTRRRSR